MKSGKENLFLASIAISICLHSILLFSWDSFQFGPRQKPAPPVEVKPRHIDYKPLKRKRSPRVLRPPTTASGAKEEEVKEKAQVVKTAKEKIISERREQDAVVKLAKKEIKEAALVKPEAPTDLVVEPASLDYLRAVRELILKEAQEIDYDWPKEGKVFLNFTVENNGSLRQIEILQSKSTASEILRRLAARSVASASPFPPFPKELDLPRITLKLEIFFEEE